MKILFMAIIVVFSSGVYSKEECVKITHYQDLVKFLGDAVENVNELEVTTPYVETRDVDFEKYLILDNWLVFKISGVLETKRKAIAFLLDEEGEQIYMSYFTEGAPPFTEYTEGYFDNDNCRIDFLNLNGLTVSLTLLSNEEFELEFFQHDDETFQISTVFSYSFRMDSKGSKMPHFKEKTMDRHSLKSG